MATKASKARAMPTFWVPTTVLWALSGSNSPWRPCYDFVWNTECGKSFFGQNTSTYIESGPIHLY